MSRRRKRSIKSASLSDEQLISHVTSSIETIRQLCHIFDGGHPYIAFTLASELHRVLTVGGVAIQLRGTRTFPTQARQLDPTNLLPENKLIAVQTGGDPPALSFVPTLDAGAGETVRIAFKDWWNRDPIYRAGVIQPGSNPTMIPLSSGEHVPLPERQVLFRRTFIELMRNKLGAHLDIDQPELLNELQRSSAFGADFGVGTPTGMLSSADGSLPMLVGPAAAMTRQIAHEVLKAFDPAYEHVGAESLGAVISNFHISRTSQPHTETSVEGQSGFLPVAIQYHPHEARVPEISGGKLRFFAGTAFSTAEGSLTQPLEPGEKYLAEIMIDTIGCGSVGMNVGGKETTEWVSPGLHREVVEAGGLPLIRVQGRYTDAVIDRVSLRKIL